MTYKTMIGWTRLAVAFFLQLALQGCGALPVVAGGTPDAPSFMVLRDGLLLTSVTVACESGGAWQTQWQISGETTSNAIEYGVVPQGMTTVVAPAPIRSQGQICSVEVHVKRKSGKPAVGKSLWVLDPIVRSCRTERSCIDFMRDSITRVVTFPANVGEG